MLRCSRPRPERGFTLIEILVVCAIVAIVLGLAAARLGQSDAGRLRGAADELVRQLEAARDEAVTRGQSVAFSSDGQGYQFWLASGSSREWIALPASDTLRSRGLPEGVTLDGMYVNGSARPLGERVVFSLSGISDPFMLTLGKETSRVEIVADALGRIESRDAQ